MDVLKAIGRSIGWRIVNITQALFLGTFILACVPLAVVVFVVTWNRDNVLSLARAFWGPMNMVAGLSPVVVEGREHVPRDRACIIMFNHQSMIDILVAFMSVPVALRFIGKKALMYVPIVGAFMWLMGMVFVDRDNSRKAMASLKKAAKVIRKDAVLCAFPEGTRSRDGTIGPFKKGMFMLAIEAGVPIVPAALEGADVVVPLKGWRPRPNTVRVKFGAPVETANLTHDDREALIVRVRETMLEMHTQIGGKGGTATRVSSRRREDSPVAA